MKKPYATKRKKAIWKGYILCDYKYRAVWQRQSYEESQKLSGCQELGMGGMNKQNTVDFRIVKLFPVTL
jgi:hypothetical protein